jgi:hypothetical protein
VYIFAHYFIISSFTSFLTPAERRGIKPQEIKVAVTSDLTPPAAEDYQSENVEINEVEIAALDKNRITVQELEE